MSVKPKISIIVPCYKQAQFLPEALNSLLAQSFQDWECIIVNDGSPDNTAEVAGVWINKDTRFHYIEKSNGGISSARNCGLATARGEFIQFLDADDLLEPEKLSWQVSFLDVHPQTGIVYGDMQYFLEDNSSERRYTISGANEPWMAKVWQDPRQPLEKLLHGNIMGIHCPLIRRAVIERAGFFREGMHAMEDWYFFLRCAAAGAIFDYSPAPNTLALVRLHAASKTNDRIGMFAGEFELAVYSGFFLPDKKLKQENFNLGVARLFESSLGFKDYQLLRLAWANRSAQIIRPCLRAWLKLHPQIAKLLWFRRKREQYN